MGVTCQKKGTEKLDSELCSKLLTDGVRLRCARLRFQRPTEMRCRLNSREENSQFGRLTLKSKENRTMKTEKEQRKTQEQKRHVHVFSARYIDWSVRA